MAPLDFLVRHVYPSCWLGGSICREETSTAAALLRSRGTARVRNSRLGTATTYTEAVELMKNHFAAPQSALLRRVIFRRRHQQTDTGATVSLLNLAIYMQFFSHEPLGPPTTTLGGYANSEIDIVGSFQLPVRYGEKTLPVFWFNIARHGTNLGLDLFNGLGFTLLYTAGSEIHTVAIPWQQQWPAVFSGCLDVFAHQPLLDPKVTPVIQPLRCSPLALHNDISSQLQSMLDDDIIEQVNASPWISNLVVKKRSGWLRFCMDLRAVNKAIIPDKYPSPANDRGAHRPVPRVHRFLQTGPPPGLPSGATTPREPQPHHIYHPQRGLPLQMHGFWPKAPAASKKSWPPSSLRSRV
ncbi:hypothetical protein SKAU_G00416730 [Synaphobranchus kaupii]|uniref:Uncharacterized protein n=1 Tax=Synaphobranchus kaupii TaxID=118154 RepID=A0A9Q1IAR4_SYNKA|nr:hypothetical protein SKAU_G00416730 [Synaphobranchus kaupii]